MLNNQTLETLHQLKLAGMAQAYAQQLEQPAAHDLSFDERLALLVGAETTERDNRKQIRLLGLAHLRQSAACVEDLLFGSRRFGQTADRSSPDRQNNRMLCGRQACRRSRSVASSG
jgi:hypothetical protein